MTDFGYSTIGSAGADNIANNWVWCKATSLPASGGTLTSIQAHCAVFTGSSSSICMALYSDNAGVPDVRLAANETPVAVGLSYAWVSQAFSQAIVAGTQYWFGIRCPSAGFPDTQVHFDTNGSLTEMYFKTTTGNFPASAGAATPAANERWSIYGTYTPAGAVDPIGRIVSSLQAIKRASLW